MSSRKRFPDIHETGTRLSCQKNDGLVTKQETNVLACKVKLKLSYSVVNTCSRRYNYNENCDTVTLYLYQSRANSPIFSFLYSANYSKWNSKIVTRCSCSLQEIVVYKTRLTRPSFLGEGFVVEERVGGAFQSLSRNISWQIESKALPEATRDIVTRWIRALAARRSLPVVDTCRRQKRRTPVRTRRIFARWGEGERREVRTGRRVKENHVQQRRRKMSADRYINSAFKAAVRARRSRWSSGYYECR